MLSSGTVAAETVAPDTLVCTTVSEVLDIIKHDTEIQSGNSPKFIAMLDNKVMPHFDMDRMSRIMLGKYWENATKEQQDAFIKEFVAFASRVYGTGLSDTGNKTIKCEPPRPHANNGDVTVKMLVLQPGTETGQVDLYLSKTADEWKVYDIILEGISLMVTYRGQFTPLARQSGMDGLIQKLVERNKQPLPPIASASKK